MTRCIILFAICVMIILLVIPNNLNCRNIEIIENEMSTNTFIRTENDLGPGLSLIFQSFINGPSIDGIDCELHQVERLLSLELKSFTITNYSGMWEESDFPDDPEIRTKLIRRQMEEDQIWNDLKDFNEIVVKLIFAIENRKLTDDLIKHQNDWWNNYFDIPDEEKDFKDYFLKDLKIIHVYLNKMTAKGETNVAFYVN